MGTPLWFAWDNLLSLISQRRHEPNLIFLLLLQLACLSGPAHRQHWSSHLLQLGLGSSKFLSLSSLTTVSLGACSDAMVKGLLFHNWDLLKTKTKQSKNLMIRQWYFLCFSLHEENLTEHLRGRKYRFEGPVHHGEEGMNGRIMGPSW